VYTTYQLNGKNIFCLVVVNTKNTVKLLPLFPKLVSCRTKSRDADTFHLPKLQRNGGEGLSLGLEEELKEDDEYFPDILIPSLEVQNLQTSPLPKIVRTQAI
jgi:hypothetical protein